MPAPTSVADAHVVVDVVVERDRHMDIALVTGAGEFGGADVREAALAVDRPLIAALRARDAEVHRPVWSDPDVDWSAYDLAVVRTTWDYPERRDEFVAWAERAGAATRLLNPPDVLRWNSHKSYLVELEERGAPIVPTAWLGQGDRVDLGELLASRGWVRAVVKPAVGGGGEGVRRVAAGPEELAHGQRHLDELLATGDAFVQPFLDSVMTRGELSVVVVEGEVSHAVRKVPQEGEFRIHQHRGGRYRAEELDAEVAALARWIVESTGADLPIARVDLIEDDVGTLQLAELEVTEPDLYLYVDTVDAAGRLADALVRRATASG